VIETDGAGILTWTTPTALSLTANRATEVDGTGTLVASAVTSTELGTLGGVTAGAVTASKAVIVDASSEYPDFGEELRNIGMKRFE